MGAGTMTKRTARRKSASTTAAGDKPKNDVYQMVTDKIVAALESGTIPWRQPWDARKSTQGARNAVTGKAYRGINPWLLNCSALAAGYSDPRWLSYKQAQDLGGSVRKGEHSTMVVFWKIGKIAAETINSAGETVLAERKTFMLRYYNVFNVQQCDGLKLKDLAAPLNDHEPLELAEAIIANMPNRPSMSFGDNRAYYTPSLDTIRMPALGAFAAPEGYYGTAFHELSHSTGHKSRLNRHGLETGIAAFGSEVYSREELAAEFGAAFLCAHAGISAPVIENQAAYIQSWTRALKDDRKLVVVAASQGQRAAEWILGGMLAEMEEDTEADD
jgi:antirestriction protein ArdC